MDEETFTDFMVRTMAGEDHVSQAIVVLRRKDGTIGYRCLNQEFADSLGLIRFAQLSLENDLISKWRDD